MHKKPKKSLGQNFLADKNVLNKIVSACNFSLRDTVLEIGSGKGELTRLVAERTKKVYAVEIDKDLKDSFNNNLAEFRDRVKLINKDIIKVDLRELFGKGEAKIRVAGNIPYYITTPIIEYLLTYRSLIQDVFLTVQKEFARRVISPAGSKEYGALTCFIQYYAQAKILFSIKKGSFYPVPKVDSSLLHLVFRSCPAVDAQDPKLFFKLIRSAFNQRRKTLVNSLRRIVPDGRLESFFREYDIDRKIRPERLTLQDFANLANSLKK
ncbi:MAG: ribosomal RNA small subunit methyltransferase A [Candidatus Omnitrophica bacterium]|nr:ribosomal RNA small subunit methyltransferase A [Candidatus Omnitrophota bacterium]